MIKRICIFILITMMASLIYAVEPYDERMDDFEAVITTVISNQANGVEYHYTVNYSSQNKRGLMWLTFDISANISMYEFVDFKGIANRNIVWRKSAPYSIGGYSGSKLTFSAWKTLGSAKPIQGTFTWINSNLRLYSEIAFLRPGEILNIYITAKGEDTIPGVANLEGYCAAASWVFADYDDNYPAEYIAQHKIARSPKIIKIVGPGPKPKSPLAMIDHLIATTTGAYNENWISKDDVYQGLMDKLNSAKSQIQRGIFKYHTAKNIMGAYKHLLDAQRQKAIVEECYQMLYINADVMIDML